jgi:hypothetical protein
MMSCVLKSRQIGHIISVSLEVLCSMLLASCDSPAPLPLDQQVYIWQRQWTPNHTLALAQSRQTFSTLRVLAAQDYPKQGWIHAHIDFAVLQKDARPVIAVIRLDGQLPQLNNSEIANQIQQVISTWQSKGLNLVGIEIDHDCASQRLSEYAVLLEQLKQKLPKPLRLSITALPAWLDSPELDSVLEIVDSSVLQVHAVQRVQLGLFDEAKAESWVTAYAKRSAHDFYVALPAYSAGLTADGRVESEVRLSYAGQRQELRVDPHSVAKFMQFVQDKHEPKLRGLVWFRLPLADDVRAWSWTTLHAVVTQHSLEAQFDIALKPSAKIAGLYDIVLTNSGNLDANLPVSIHVQDHGCEAGDALSPYALNRQSHQWVFSQSNTVTLTTQNNQRINASTSRAIGWMRCLQLKKEDISYERDATS